MHDAAASFVERQHWPDGGDFALMSREQVEKLVANSFTAGYMEGRNDRQNDSRAPASVPG